MTVLNQALQIHRERRSESAFDPLVEAATLDEPDALQRLASDFATVVEQRGTSSDQDKLKQLQDLRVQIVEAMLALNEPELAALAPSVNVAGMACIKSGIRNYPRTPREDALFDRCMRAVASASPDEAAVRWLSGMIMAEHGFELPRLPALAIIPQAIRQVWLSFLLEVPSAFGRR